MEENVFNSIEKAKSYIDMLEGYDNSFVITNFKAHIDRNCKVLELGMGPALDYDSLKDEYDITVSDTSDAFISLFNKKYDAIALNICVKDIEIDEKFDCIFTNKVLQVLNDDEMKESFINQYNALNDNGMIFHCIWIGEGYDDCPSNYTSIDKLEKILMGLFTIDKIIAYSEIKQDDSIILVAKKSLG